MYLLRSICLLWYVPLSWMDALLVRKKPLEERYARMATWSKKMMGIFHIQMNVVQEEELPSDGPILFVSNHQSEFDMLMLLAAIQVPYTFISKVENKKALYIGSWSKSLEVLFFDREDRTSGIHMLREAARRLKEQKNLLIFPEGTRSKGHVMHEMQAGSIQPAFMAKAYVVPVVLLNSYTYMDIIKHKGTCHMHILKPIPFAEYKPLKAEGLIAQLQIQMQKILDDAQLSK